MDREHPRLGREVQFSYTAKAIQHPWNSALEGQNTNYWTREVLPTILLAAFLVAGVPAYCTPSQ